MKKYIVVLLCLFASVILLPKVEGQDLGKRIKHAACEKICERNYQNCMKEPEKSSSKESEENYADDVKNAAKEETCAYAREKCLEECNE
jgi:hypothetical protein